MNITTFIKETINQIALATQELNGNDCDASLVVNPTIENIQYINDEPYTICLPSDKRPKAVKKIINIDFDIIVTTEENNKKGANVGIKVLNFGGIKEMQNNNVNRIKFSIPVVLPSKYINHYKD